jgi:hypothetical protein
VSGGFDDAGSGSGGFDLAIERLVLDGIDLPADAIPTFAGLVEAELRRILDGAAASSWSAPDELRPILLSAPPDVPALARELAERIAAGAAAAGGRDV